MACSPGASGRGRPSPAVGGPKATSLLQAMLQTMGSIPTSASAPTWRVHKAPFRMQLRFSQLQTEAH